MHHHHSNGFNRRCRRNRHGFNQNIVRNNYGTINSTEIGNNFNPFLPNYLINEKMNFKRSIQASEQKDIAINSKISKIQNKIQKELNSRRQLIQIYNLQDEDCFIQTIDNHYQLTKGLILYLIQKLNSNYLKKKIFEKKLEKIRFSLNNSQIDLFIQYGFRFSKKNIHYNSILESNASGWKKWKEILDFISSNINNYKLYIKEKNLSELSNKYNKITILRKEKSVLICEICGSQNLKDAKYCHYCGERL